MYNTVVLFLFLLLIASCKPTKVLDKDALPQAQTKLSSPTSTIVFIPKAMDNVFWTTMRKGAQTAADEEGMRLVWKSTLTEGTPSEQIQKVYEAVTLKANGLILAPQDAWALSQPVDSLEKLNIPVLAVDSDIGTDRIISFIATNNIKGGALAAEQLALVLQKKGKVLLFRFLPGAPATTRREEAFLEELRIHYPEIQVVSQNHYSGATEHLAFQQAQKVLAQFHDVDGVFCPNEQSCDGLLRALRQVDKNKRIHLVGFDANPGLVAGLREGHVQALILQDPYDMGYTSVKKMADHLRGKPIKRHIGTAIAVASSANLDNPRIQNLLPK